MSGGSLAGPLSDQTKKLCSYKCTSVFPWNPTKKRAELFHRDSRFVVIIPDGGQVDAAGLRAFTMFRFDTEEDIQGSMELVVYWCVPFLSSKNATLKIFPQL